MSDFRLDRKGISEVLKQIALNEITTLTAHVAANAGPEAESQVVITDRAHGQVRVPADAQAKDGVLTRAAAAAGLEVKPK